MTPRILAFCALAPLAANRPGDTQVVRTERIAADQEVGDITGYYHCKGQESGGKNYQGVCVISRKGDVYLIQWMIGAGSTFTGIAVRQGDNLAASWAIPSDKGAVVRGVNLYRIESGPRLVGRWATIPGNTMMQSETLTFLRPMEDEGDEEK